jgi:hypothetical protein
VNLNKILYFIYISQALVSGGKNIPRYWYIYIVSRYIYIYITQIWVIAICVVMDHNTVIFQKEKGGGVHIKITGMQDSNQRRQK